MKTRYGDDFFVKLSTVNGIISSIGIAFFWDSPIILTISFVCAAMSFVLIVYGSYRSIHYELKFEHMSKMSWEDYCNIKDKTNSNAIIYDWYCAR